MVVQAKQIGLVLTPTAIAEELVRWAVQDRHDRILDIGAGEGVFLEETVKKLKHLGCLENEIEGQVFGVERNSEVYQAAYRRIENTCGIALPYFLNSDLFEKEFPPVSVIVGNPPYVRRNTLEEVDRVRERVIHHNLFLARLPRLTDLYSYFLIYAAQFLNPGGRMAVIVSSSWMDTDYGIALKEFLLQNFKIRILATCEARLFTDALIKAVLLFAEKGRASDSDVVRFLRLPDFVPGFSGMADVSLESIGSLWAVPQNQLDPRHPWGIYLRQAQAYFSVPSEICISLRRLAKTRIGIQPLARDFYILDSDKVEKLGIPKVHLQPLVFSPKTVGTTVVKRVGQWSHYILYADQPKEKLRNRALRNYIEGAEKAEVFIRGKDKTVVGYQNLPRLMKTGRKPWYNLVDEIRRRGRYSILIPRRFYEQFVVVWNKAQAVPNENFIEAEPNQREDLLVLLGILNTSFFELVCRSRAQHYGGGVFNLNPMDVQELPILNFTTIDDKGRRRIAAAYRRFATDPSRDALDLVIAGCFGIDQETVGDIQTAVAELRRLSSAAKTVGTMSA